MKHNYLFRTAILSGMVVASCLSVKAYEESNTLREVPKTPVTISENGSLVTKLTPVWERQLLNNDANQNQMSMAVANGNIYVCVDYYDAFLMVPLVVVMLYGSILQKLTRMTMR